MIKAGCAKNVAKERKVKNAVGKKCPLKTVPLAVDEKEEAIKSSQGRAQSWWSRKSSNIIITEVF